MVEAALLGLVKVFAWPAIGYMLLGILIGLMVGILPGIGGLFSLAVLIPFTFKMDPASAFALLLGAHAPSYTGGAITTILLNTPGDPPNAATLFDGYPMTKKGEAGRALGAALTSSAVGGVLGALYLILLIPVMRPLILLFAPPEFFMMAVVGIAFIAVISGQSLLKGLIAGGFGLLLGMVGLDPSTSVERFTFGTLFLWDGISLVPVTLGLFAVTEMIETTVEGESISEKLVPSEVGGVLRGIKDTFQHFWLVFRCSILGNIIGIIPGIGGDTACFFAYGHAKQTEKNRDQFGTGVVEGVIAPQSAINAKEGGALVPTVAFGIPGSAGMAILLGAFYIQGIKAGPDMLHNNLWLIFLMAWTIVLANIIGSGLCIGFANKMARVALLPGDYLFPVVLLLCGIGAYCTRNALGDLVVTMIFGFVGYGMKKYEWPRPVVIIGLVLARVAEKNLLLSLRLYQETFFLRPITLILIAIVLVTLMLTLRGRRASSANPRLRGEEPQGGRGRVKLSFRHVFDLVVVILLGIYIGTAFGYNSLARLMPLVVSIPIFVLAVLQTIGDFRQGRRAPDVSRKEERPSGEVKAPGDKKISKEVNAFAWATSLFVALYLFGFVLTTLLYTFGALKLRSRFSWKPSIGVSLGCFAFLFIVMVYGLRVDLYPGVIMIALRKMVYGY
jgi:putative tricarboxylic transport membrane protein